MKNLLGLSGIFVAIVCLAMGCGKEEVNSSVENRPTEKDSVSIQIGDTIELSDGYKLSFIKLIEESRCPANAMCVWQGRVVVEFQAEKANKITQFTLSSDPYSENPTTASVLGYEVTLLNVWPYPGTSVEEIQPGDYVAEVKIKKLSE